MDPFTWGVLAVAGLIALQVAVVMAVEGRAPATASHTTQQEHHTHTHDTHKKK